MAMGLGKWAAILGVVVVLVALPRWAWGQAASASAAVTVTTTDVGFVLDNGIVRALVSNESGDLISLQYKGKEMLATVMGPDGQPDLKTARSQYARVCAVHGSPVWILVARYNQPQYHGADLH